MRRQLASLFLLLALIYGVSAASGQSEPDLERLEIAFWPEYDREAVLVIYRFELGAGVTLPATASLPIPAAAGEPHAVASLSPSGDLLVAPFSRQVEGEWATIFVQLDQREGQLEYYDPLTFDGPQRSYVYTWPGGPAIANLIYELQHPVEAGQISVSPPGTSAYVGQDGLTYTQGALGAVEADESFEIGFEYRKDNDRLSIAQPPLSQPAAPTTPVSPDLNQALPWILGGLGGLMVLGGLFWISRTRRAAPPSARRRRRKPAAAGVRNADVPPKMEVAPEETGAIFCHQCGAQTSSGDRFCRRCGTRLRT